MTTPSHRKVLFSSDDFPSPPPPIQTFATSPLNFGPLASPPAFETSPLASSRISLAPPVSAKVGLSSLLLRTKPSSEGPPAFKKPRSPSYPLPLAAPDSSAFAKPEESLYSVHEHRELQEARGIASSSASASTPFLALYNRTPYDQSLYLLKSMEMRSLLLQKANDQANLRFVPFDIPVDHERTARVASIEQLRGGKNSLVFKCELSGNLKGTYVLKIINDKTLETAAGTFYEDPRDVMTRSANQLRRYAQYSKIPYLNLHTAPHVNFDSLLPAVEPLLEIEDEDAQSDAFRNFLLQHPFPVTFVPFIPNPFPLEFNPRSEIWTQAQTLFRVAHVHKVPIDARRSNLRFAIQYGRPYLYLTDLFELNEDDPTTLYSELFATLIPYEHWKYLDPRPASRHNHLFSFKSSFGKKEV